MEFLALIFALLAVAFTVIYFSVLSKKISEDHENNEHQQLQSSPTVLVANTSSSQSALHMMETTTASMLQFKLQLDKLALQIDKLAQEDLKLYEHTEQIAKTLHTAASCALDEKDVLQTKLEVAEHAKRNYIKRMQFHYEMVLAQQQQSSIRSLKRRKMKHLRKINDKQTLYMKQALLMYKQYTYKTKAMKLLMDENNKAIQKEHEEALNELKTNLAQKEKQIEQQQMQLSKFNEALKQLTLNSLNSS